MVGGSGLEPLTSAMSTRTALIELKAYLNRLLIRGCSVNYVNKIRECLMRYLQWADDISPDSAIKFVGQFIDRKPNTRARYTTYLRGFLKHLEMALDLKVKVPRQLPEFVAIEDIEKLKSSLHSKHTHRGCRFRDIMLVETAANTGLRRGELANLRVKDIDFAGGRLIVKEGKGGKDRVIPLVPSLNQSLFRFCRGKLPDEKVFGLSARSLGMKIYEWSKKAGVKLHTHSFRHYFATTLVERGANIRAVQELLGHTNLNTTQVYLAVTGRHLEEAINLLD